VGEAVATGDDALLVVGLGAAVDVVATTWPAEGAVGGGGSVAGWLAAATGVA
jgi:hypothetical protein